MPDYFDIGTNEGLITRAHAIRRAVFIDEQRIAEEEEWDDLDHGAIHFIAVDGGHDVGTGRLNIRDGIAKLQRIAVLKAARGRNIGYDIVARMIVHARDKGAVFEVRLSAQCYALPFYERFGFVAHGETYDDACIPHRDMRLVL